MNDDDESPNWGDGEALTGDAYVKWIRGLRGEEMPSWAAAALATEGVGLHKRVEEPNGTTRISMANPKQVIMIRTGEETNVFDTAKLAWKWLKSRYEKYHDDEGMHRSPRIKGTMDYKKADHLWFNQNITALKKSHKGNEYNSFNILRKSGSFVASITVTYFYKKGALENVS